MKKKNFLAKLSSVVLIALLLMSSTIVYAAEGEDGATTEGGTETVSESDYEFFGEVPYEEALAEVTPMLANDLLGDAPAAWGPLFDSGMAKTGTAKVVGICVDFADKRFDEGDDEAAFEKILNDEIDEANPYYPFESLHAYYKRASYGQLDITGDVYTYHSPNNREYYVNNDDLFTDAMNALDDEVDFSQYDGNNDGKIDAVYIHFAGGDTGWNNQWWSKAWYLDDGVTYDGKIVFNRVFLHCPSNTAAGPHTLIHETGHVLGLPDLYSYDKTVSGKTGTLSWDLMENNTGDMDGYCKWLLGWIDESKITKVVANENGIKISKGGEVIKEIPADEYGCSETELSLDSFDTDELEEYGGLIALSNNEIDKFSSFYLMQYETPSGNQSVQYYDNFTLKNYDIPNGFRVYRVQGDIDTYSGSFIHQNTYGTLHNQLIEVLDMDEADSHTGGEYMAPKGVSAPDHKCFLEEGGVINCNTYPSTNFRENNLLGFTGLVIKCLSTDETSGKLLLGYSPEGRKDPSEFTLELKDSEYGINDFKVLFVTPWAIEQLNYDGFLYVNDKEYPASIRLRGNLVEVHVWLSPENLHPGDDCKVKFPEGMFKIAEIGYRDVLSKEFTVPVPVGPQAKIEEKIIVGPVTPEDTTPTISNTVVSDDKAYVVWMDNPYGNATLHISEFSKDNPKEGTDIALDGFAKEYSYTLNKDSLYLYKTGDKEFVLKIRAYDRANNLLDYYYWINTDTKKIENSYVHNNLNGLVHYFNNITVGDDGTIFIMESEEGRLYYTAIANENGEIKMYTDSVDTLSSNFGIYRATDPATNKAYLLIRQFASENPEIGTSTHSVLKIKSSDLKNLIATNALVKGLEEKSERTDLEVEGGFDFMALTLSSDGVMALGKLFEYDPVESMVGRDYIEHFDKSGKRIGKMRLDRLNVLNGSEFFNITADASHVFVDSESRNSETGNWSEKIILNIADIAGTGKSMDCGKYICTNVHAGGYFVEPDKFVTFHLNSDYSARKSELVSYIIKVDNNEKPEPKPVPVPTGDSNYTMLFVLLMIAAATALFIAGRKLTHKTERHVK